MSEAKHPDGHGHDHNAAHAPVVADERWIVAFSNILFEKRVLTPEILANKMREVERRAAGDGENASEGADSA
jgi:hypothetical protein